MASKRKKKGIRWYRDPQPVILGWQDAQSGPERWAEPCEIRTWAEDEHKARIKTAGMLLGESKHYYYLTGCTQCDGDYYLNCQRVPKGCITDVEILKRGKQRKGDVPRRLKK